MEESFYSGRMQLLGNYVRAGTFKPPKRGCKYDIEEPDRDGTNEAPCDHRMPAGRPIRLRSLPGASFNGLKDDSKG